MTEALVDVDLALELLRGRVAAERQLLLLDDLQRHVLWRATAGAAVPVRAAVHVAAAAARSRNGSWRVAVARGGAEVARELHFTAGAFAQRAQHLEAPDARARARAGQTERYGAVDRRAVREQGRGGRSGGRHKGGTRQRQLARERAWPAQRAARTNLALVR